MWLAVWAFGATNFALGVALALCLLRWPKKAPLSIDETPAEPQQPLLAETEVAPPPPTPTAGLPPPEESSPQSEEELNLTSAVALDLAAEIPLEWFDVLKGVQKCNSFVEASVQVLRLEVGKYRSALVAIDDRVRACRSAPDDQTLRTILADLTRLNENWLRCQADAGSHLAARKQKLGALAAIGEKLEQVLLQQAAQIETTCGNVVMLDFTTDPQSGCQRLLFEVAKLIDMAHELRDRMQESLLAIMTVEERLGELDKRLQVDPLTELVSRPGLEAVLFEWWRDDPGRKRLASVVLVDVDQVARRNEQLGVAATDRLLAALAGLLQSCLRTNRGYDVLTRYSGQRFALFVGDTGPHGATSMIERLRKTTAQSTFEIGDQTVELTLTCGVTEVLTTDDHSSLWDRLEKTLRHAKQAGHNRTSVDRGDGPQSVESPDFEVKGRVVRVEEG